MQKYEISVRFVMSAKDEKDMNEKVNILEDKLLNTINQQDVLEQIPEIELTSVDIEKIKDTEKKIKATRKK